MKKKLEAELISIAHRILKLKNKSDLIQLHLETQRLYEKLSVLRFVEENFADVKPTIGYSEIEAKIATAFDAETPEETPVVDEEVKSEPAKEIKEKPKTQSVNEIKPEEVKAAPVNVETTQPAKTDSDDINEQIERSGKAIADFINGIRSTDKDKPAGKPEAATTTDEVIASATEPFTEVETEENMSNSETEPSESKDTTEEVKQEVVSEAPTESKQDDFFRPAFELAFEPKTEEKPVEAPITASQIAFDDLLGQSYVDPVFVKPEDLQHEKQTVKAPEQSNVIPISRNFSDNAPVISINKSDNLNDRVSKGITIGLNDRIAFMNHLFNNSSEDYNRVLSQLITFDAMSEAKQFIDTMVKPDYNNWVGKEDYEQRFMEIIEKKFS